MMTNSIKYHKLSITRKQDFLVILKLQNYLEILKKMFPQYYIDNDGISSFRFQPDTDVLLVTRGLIVETEPIDRC